MSELIRENLNPPVARLTLDRPPLNVMTTKMMLDLADAVDRASRAEGIRLIRIDAVGKVFCAGVDVSDHIGEALQPMMDALVRLFDALERAPLPTVSVVHGAALGGGCELTLGTDLCLASDRASFGQPEIRLGVFAPPASVLLPRMVGERRALELLLTGATIAASEAKSYGLVNQVFAHERFEEEVDAWIAKLMELSGAALRYAKRAVVESWGRPFAEAHLALGRIYTDELMATADANEGLQSFIEKRSPEWKHS